MIPPNATLVLCAHGSPRPGWRSAIDRLHSDLTADEALARRYPGGVLCAFLEHDQPRLVPAARDPLDRGHSVDVMPLFLSPGRHRREDLPRLLGLTSNARPGEDVLPASASIRLLPAPDWGDVLRASVLRRTLARLPESMHRSVLLVHYGSTLVPCPWAPLVETLGDALRGEGVHEIRDRGAGHHRPNPIEEIATTLVELLASDSAVAIVTLGLAKSHIQREVIPSAIARLDPEQRARVGWLPDAILPDPDVHAAIAAHALKVASGA